MSRRVRLHSVRVENLRGYSRAQLPLDRPKILLVGKNNSGKTSILKLIDWLLNRLDLEAVKRGTSPNHDELKFLLPARNTRNRARRLWLNVKIDDARRHRRFKCDKGIASLRINLKLTPRARLFLKLGRPTRGESSTSDEDAIELLRELRNSVLFIYVPSFRDAGSQRFLGTLNSAFQARLSERALHSKQAGAPAEYRRIKSAKAELERVAEELAKPLWKDMQSHLPPGLARKAVIDFNCEPKDLVAWMAQRLVLRISTGTHDENTVETVELGSGLQSLLDLAIQKSSVKEEEVQLVLAIEEPEAFLHPSAQRTFSRLLMSDIAAAVKIVTTHSPIVIEEADYGDVVLVRNHEFFIPAEQKESRRAEINTALMTGFGAEMMFARGVLFVEGEGDRQFFEVLRRRIAKNDLTGAVDDAVVIPVGSKTHFAPWIQLVRSYGMGENRPIRWLVVADSDAVSEVRSAFRHAGITVPQAIGTALAKASQANNTSKQIKAIRQLNSSCRDESFGLRLLPVDLEFAALKSASETTIKTIVKKLGWAENGGVGTKDEILRRLGSKAVSNPSDGKKAPWIRGVIARELPWSEISTEIKEILEDWMSLVMQRDEARKLLEN